jgi:hypothetical protein
VRIGLRVGSVFSDPSGPAGAVEGAYFGVSGFVAAVKPSATLPGMKSPTGTGAIEKTGPDSTPSTAPAGTGPKANDVIREHSESP